MRRSQNLITALTLTFIRRSLGVVGLTFIRRSLGVGGLFLSLFLLSCGESPNNQQADTPTPLFPAVTLLGEAQGTTYSIKYLNDSTDYKSGIDSLLLAFDKDLSNWREGSLINRINAFDRTDTVFAFVDSTKFFSVVFDVSREIFEKTEGAFDPTVYPLVEAWGFGLKNRANVTKELIDSLRTKVSMQAGNVDMIEMVRDTYFYEETQIRKGQKGVKLDFNAIAQGYSVDLIGEYLENRGINDYMVELGGEVLCKGVNPYGEPWRIAIDKPVGPDEAREFQALLDVSNKAVATSGSYRKYYEEDGKRYSHTIDPRTGYPVTHNLLSATVMASNCAQADAYATAFMVMGVQGTLDFLANHPEMGMEVYLIYDENGELQALMSDGLQELINS